MGGIRVEGKTGVGSRPSRYGFSLVDGFDLIDKTRHRLEQTTFRVTFSDPYSRQLLARRVVSRPKEMLKMRSELAFLVRLYLEPILISRGIGRDHSIELLNLIKVLNLPKAGWHRFKSRRKAIFLKAIHELHGMKTAGSRGIDVEIQQGLNQLDFMLVACLLPGGSREGPNNTQRPTMQVCPAQCENQPELAIRKIRSSYAT